MLPLFVLASAVGVVAGPPPRRLPAVALAVGLTLAATPWLAFNRSRPILASVALETSPSILRASRTEQYFAKRPELQTPYQSAAALLGTHHARRVGLVFTEDDWEYPLWILLGLAGTGARDRAHPGPEWLGPLRQPGPAGGVRRDRVRQLATGFRPAQTRPLTVLFMGEAGAPAGS